MTTVNKNSHLPTLLVMSNCSEITRFKNLLGKEGHPIQSCPDLETALTLARKQDFKLALVSIDSNWQCVAQKSRALKRLCPAIKIVALSGLAHRSIIKNAIDLGAIDDEALKTISDQDLISIISGVLNAKPKQDGVNAVFSKVRSPLPSNLPSSSLLTQLEETYPGILRGSWSQMDDFSCK